MHFKILYLKCLLHNSSKPFTWRWLVGQTCVTHFMNSFSYVRCGSDWVSTTFFALTNLVKHARSVVCTFIYLSIFIFKRVDSDCNQLAQIYLFRLDDHSICDGEILWCPSEDDSRIGLSTSCVCVIKFYMSKMSKL